MLSCKGEFVVKLPRNRVDALVTARIGDRFDGGRGRAIKEWLVVRECTHRLWLQLAREAPLLTRSAPTAEHMTQRLLCRCRWSTELIVTGGAARYIKPGACVSKGSKCSVLSRCAISPLLEHPEIAESRVVRSDESAPRGWPSAFSNCCR